MQSFETISSYWILGGLFADGSGLFGQGSNAHDQSKITWYFFAVIVSVIWSNSKTHS